MTFGWKIAHISYPLRVSPTAVGEFFHSGSLSREASGNLSLSLSSRHLRSREKKDKARKEGQEKE